MVGFEQGETHDFTFYHLTHVFDSTDGRWTFSKSIARILSEVNPKQIYEKISLNHLKHLIYDCKKHCMALQLGMAFKILFNADLTKEELEYCDTKGNFY